MNEMKMRCRGAVVAAAIVAASGFGVCAQEKSPTDRFSGAWMLNPTAGSAVPDPSGRGASDGKNGGAQAGSGQPQSEAPPTPGVRDLMQLMDDLVEVPRHMAFTVTPTGINLVDDHGVSRKFSPTNKFEKVDFATGKASFKTRWEGATIVQDINSDAIDLTRTFETSPDGAHLTVTIVIRRQPDPKAMASQGNRGETRHYVYDRVG